MRADMVSCFGNDIIKTPNFDRLAQNGTVFEQCHVQHTVCSPSRCSFLTGLYPHTSGHRSLWNLLKTHEPSTYTYLKDAGYDVIHTGKNDGVAEEAYEQSLTEYRTNEHLKPKDECLFTRYFPEGDLREQYSFLSGPTREENAGDYYHVQSVIDYIKGRKSDDPPFFAFLALTYPHCRYQAPEPWYSMYDPDDLPDLKPADLPNKPTFMKLIREYRQLDKLTPYELKKILAVYMGMISYSDHLLGMLLDTLEEEDLMDETAIFAFSDHGDWAGNYGLVEKWSSGLDDDLTHIPMVVQVPGGKKGHRVKEQVECFDIMPTTLELAGVECRHSHFAKSMMPMLMNGEAGDKDRVIMADGGYDLGLDDHCFEGKPADGLCSNPKHQYYPKAFQQQKVPQSVSRVTMIRTLDYKFIRRPNGVDELYDLNKDPQELNNVYGDKNYTEIKLKMIETMLDKMIQTSDTTPRKMDLRGWNKELLKKQNQCL
jgi:arylsulfatase A-like enzyme